jgi:hypothetical protein
MTRIDRLFSLLLFSLLFADYGIVANKDFEGWTVLMCASANSGVDSTELIVAQLLAHDSSSEISRVQNKDD